MRSKRQSRFMLWAAVTILALAGLRMYAQPGATDDTPTNSLPNPYKAIDHWVKPPQGWVMGAVASAAIDRSGNIWLLQRCGGTDCYGTTEDPVMEFEPSGKYLKSFGGGYFNNPHGFAMDKEGNIWVTDIEIKAGKGMTATKFSQDGKVLMTLGKPGIAGNGPDEFDQPSAIAIAPNGDIFIADGHGANGNERIVKLTNDGKFIKAWGKKGDGPGEFAGLHCLTFDNKGRLFVGDRSGSRIEIFDQEGTFIAEWKQFSRPSGIYIDKKDTIYVVDADSNSKSHPGWLRGMRIGSAKDGSVKYLIPDPNTDPNFFASSAAEGVIVDAKGVVYGAEVGPKDLKRYIKQ